MKFKPTGTLDCDFCGNPFEFNEGFAGYHPKHKNVVKLCWRCIIRIERVFYHNAKFRVRQVWTDENGVLKKMGKSRKQSS